MALRHELNSTGASGDAASHGQQATEDRAKIGRLKRILSCSESGAAFLKWANQRKVRYVIDHTMGDNTGAVYQPLTNTVFLNADSSEGFQVSALAHEIRHAWQFHEGLFPTVLDEKQTPPRFAICKRLLEADAYTWQIQIAAELSASGYHDSWNQCFERAHLRPMMDAFEAACTKDRKNIRSRKAMEATFYAWFGVTALREHYDADSLKVYLSVMMRRAGGEESEMPHRSPTIKSFTEKALRKQPQLDAGPDFDTRKRSLFRTPDGGYYVEEIVDEYLENCDQFFQIQSLPDSDAELTLKRAWSLYDWLFSQAENAFPEPKPACN